MRIDLAGRSAAATCAIAAAALLGACGSSGAHADPARPAPTTTTTAAGSTTTTTTSASSTTTAPTSTTTAPASTTITPAPTTTTGGGSAAGAAACTPAQLQVEMLNTTFTATGHGTYLFDVVNHGAACPVGGYFGIAVYDVAGHPLATTSRRLPTLSGHGPSPITLANGSSAHFTVQLGNVRPQSDAACPPVGSFHLTPPNADQQVQVDIRPDANGNRAGYCGGGVAVYPTQPGPPSQRDYRGLPPQ